MKSHVSMAQRQCVVCGCLFDTGEILLHKRLAQVLDDHTVVGPGVCPEHQAKIDEGYILCIEADRRGEVRTSRLAMLRAERWPDIFNVPAPAHSICFIDHDTFDMLEGMSRG